MNSTYVSPYRQLTKSMGNDLKIKNFFKKAGVLWLVLITLSTLSMTKVAAYQASTLIPMGNAVGINLQSDGVMVVGVPETLSDGTSVSPARNAGLSAGDIITAVGTQRVSSSSDLRSAIDKLDGSPVQVKVVRGNSELNLQLTPHKSDDGRCEFGLWMRDGIAGIGTLTFYDPQTGVFGALGHSVNDQETGILVPMRSGLISRSAVTDVVQGKAGMPGQLHGTFNAESILGSLTLNSPSGIFGKMEKNDLLRGKSPMPIGDESKIKTGEATILSNVSGTEVKEYHVEITRIYSGAEAVGRSMMLRVTDPDLIAQTGGIVQGMSGSPIIQNGKLIGAVTHVLINDPTRGYGISIEKMLNTINSDAGLKAA